MPDWRGRLPVDWAGACARLRRAGAAAGRGGRRYAPPGERMIGALMRSMAGLPEQRRIVEAGGGLWDWLPMRSSAGVTVTPSTAMQSTTVTACVNLIARSLASVPLILYRGDEETREPAADHPLYDVLSSMANPLQTAFEVRESIFANVLLHGNAYCEIEWSPGGYPAALWPMDPERVTLAIGENKALIYRYRADDGKTESLPAYRACFTCVAWPCTDCSVCRRFGQP